MMGVLWATRRLKMTTAERVKRWRKRAGLNLMQAAAECGLAQSTIWKVEAGYRVGVHVAQRLAPVLRVRWERLVKEGGGEK